MKIPPFFRDYIRLLNDEHVILEIRELALEYNLRTNLITYTPESSKALRREFLEKVRKIAKPCVADRAAYEKLVYRQNTELSA
jgi:hypothetical protein